MANVKLLVTVDIDLSIKCAQTCADPEDDYQFTAGMFTKGGSQASCYVDEF